MAQLPPDGQYLMQSEGTKVTLFERYTERTLVEFDGGDANETARAQSRINQLDELTEEQKAFAHFWSGYFYGFISSGPETKEAPQL